MDKEIEKDIKKTLEAILEYIGADEEYAKHAQLQAWLEQLIHRH